MIIIIVGIHISQIFASDILTALKPSLEHYHRRVLRSLRLYGDLALSQHDLHIVVRVAEHAYDDASKRILKPSTYRLQIFLVRDQHLRSLLPHGDQTKAGQLEKHVLNLCLRSLQLIWRPGLREARKT